MESLAREIEDLKAKEKQEEEVLRMLLDRYLNLKGTYPVQRTRMGSTTAYDTSVTFQELSNAARFAGQLPTLKDLIDEQSFNLKSIDANTIDLLVQRPLDWSRQVPLLTYLLVQPHRKFPPLLAVVTQEWAFNDSDSNYWYEKNGERRAKQSTIDFEPFDSDGKIGRTTINPNKHFTYMLDGQHRLMGIKGAMDLLQKPSIPILGKDGRPTKDVLTLTQLVQQYDLKEQDLQSIGGESVGLELIAAVQKDESLDEARRRIRSIFVHVNEYANRLTKGQSAQLDEDNGFKLVARMIALTNPLFKDPKSGENLVNMSSTTVAKRAKVITTLPTLIEMTTAYLKPVFKGWEPDIKGLVPIRPEPDALQEGVDMFDDIIVRMSKLSSFADVVRGKEVTVARNFSFEDPAGEGHMLFRPVGQQALASALSILVHHRDFDLDKVFVKLTKYDKEGMFKLESPGTLWYRIIYDPDRKRMQVRGQKLAAELLTYMLGGGIEDDIEREKLRREFAEWRSVQHEDGKIQAQDFSGKMVNPDKIELPAPITA